MVNFFIIGKCAFQILARRPFQRSLGKALNPSIELCVQGRNASQHGSNSSQPTSDTGFRIYRYALGKRRGHKQMLILMNRIDLLRWSRGKGVVCIPQVIKKALESPITSWEK